MSLTCIYCKTLEHILVSNINKHLALDSILADCQHGFRSWMSCETQLVQFVRDIISNLDGAMNRGHKQTDLIIMDFTKAFYKVPHRRLLHKLDYYGIRGRLGVNYFEKVIHYLQLHWILFNKITITITWQYSKVINYIQVLCKM